MSTELELAQRQGSLISRREIISSTIQHATGVAALVGRSIGAEADPQTLRKKADNITFLSYGIDMLAQMGSTVDQSIDQDRFKVIRNLKETRRMETAGTMPRGSLQNWEKIYGTTLDAEIRKRLHSYATEFVQLFQVEPMILDYMDDSIVEYEEKMGEATHADLTTVFQNLGLSATELDKMHRAGLIEVEFTRGHPRMRKSDVLIALIYKGVEPSSLRYKDQDKGQLRALAKKFVIASRERTTS